MKMLTMKQSAILMVINSPFGITTSVGGINTIQVEWKDGSQERVGNAPTVLFGKPFEQLKVTLRQQFR